jgi:hypothetical protein
MASLADLPEMKAGNKRIKRDPNSGHIYVWNQGKVEWEYSRKDADSDEEAIQIMSV